MDLQELFDATRQWGLDKGITGEGGKGTLKGQLKKSQEELTETRDAGVEYLLAVKLGDEDAADEALKEFKDGIGDTMVTLILAAELAGLTAEECLLFAYDEIKNRKGVMTDGIFVKDTPAAKPYTHLDAVAREGSHASIAR